MTKKIVVIGGGISGLAAAHRLVELKEERGLPLEIILVESRPETGGAIHTETVDHESGHQYLIEWGADSFLTNKPAGVRLCERLGLADALIDTNNEFRRSLVLHRGKPQPVPEGFQLMTPAKPWAVMTSPVLSWKGKLRLMWELCVPANPADDESLAAFVRRRLGREVLDNLVQPLIGGIYTSDPEKLSLRATLPRFLDMEREHRSLILAARKQQKKVPANGNQGTGARYGLFCSLKNGIGQLLSVLEACIENAATVHRGTAVTRLSSSTVGEGYELTLSTGERNSRESIQADAVICALSAFNASALTNEIAPALSEQLSQIEYASSAIAATVHHLSDFQHSLDAFGLVIPAKENRRILAVSFSSRKFPGRVPDGQVLLRTFIGGAMQPEVLQHDDGALLRIVREELTEILGMKSPEIFGKIVRHERAMPQYHVGHCERVKQIETLAEAHPGIALCGNAYHGVGIPDCIQSGESAAETLLESLSLSAIS